MKRNVLLHLVSIIGFINWSNVKSLKFYKMLYCYEYFESKFLKALEGNV